MTLAMENATATATGVHGLLWLLIALPVAGALVLLTVVFGVMGIRSFEKRATG